MNNKGKIKAIKEKLEGAFNGIEKVETKINSKGEVTFKYNFVKSIETFPSDIDTIIDDGIKSSKATIKFLKGLKDENMD